MYRFVASTMFREAIQHSYGGTRPRTTCRFLASQMKRPKAYPSTAHLRLLSSSRQREAPHVETKRQDPVEQFMAKVQRNNLPKNLICQRVEELLLGMLKRKPKLQDGPLSLDLLNAAIENANLPNERLIPRLFSLSCQVMVKSGHPLAMNEVHRQIQRLLDNHKLYLTNDLSYNSHHVNDACSQFINGVILDSKRSKRRMSTERQAEIQNIMDHLQQLCDDPSVPLAANAVSYNSFIMFLCNQDKPEEAYKLLQWMVEASTKDVGVAPRVASFTALISAFAKKNPDKAIEILQWMLDACRSPVKNVPPPNTSCFNGVLDALARSGRNDAGERAEQTLEWMQSLHDTEGLATMPDVVSFNCCINAWAKAPVPHAASRAEAVLRKMISMYENGSDVTPGTISFISAMDAWASSGLPSAPDRAASLLDLMKSTAAKSKDLKVDSYAYAVLLKAWEKSDVKHASRETRANYIQKILAVLHDMEQEGIEITPPIHNSVIMALTNFSLLSAILYFQELEERYRKGKAVIDGRTFNSGLSAMALLSKPDVAEKSMEIVARMEEYSKKDPTVKPDQTTSTVILKILSRSQSADAAEKADKLLLDMEQKGQFDTAPSSYVTVTIAWGRSNDKNKFDRVKDLLKRYNKWVKAGAIPNSSSPNVYNAALSVCQHNSDEALKTKALETALNTIMELRANKAVKPDETTYLTAFQAFRSLYDQGDPERITTLEREFANCIKDGLVSRPIVKELHNGSRQLFQKFFGADQALQTVEIPHGWSKQLRFRTRRGAHS